MIITRVVLKSPRLGAHPQVSRLASWSLRCVAQYFSHSFGPWTLSELYQLVSVIYFNTPTNICQSERFAEHLWETGTRQSLISLVAPVVSDLQSRWVLSVKHQEAVVYKEIVSRQYAALEIRNSYNRNYTIKNVISEWFSRINKLPDSRKAKSFNKPWNLDSTEKVINESSFAKVSSFRC